jgi:hypothetical protein
VWALWVGDALVFSTSPESVSARHLRGDPRATVHLEGAHVAVVDGEVRWLDAAPEGFADAYEAKYGWRMDAAHPDTPLLVLRPRTVVSWDEAQLAATMTRWTFHG